MQVLINPDKPLKVTLAADVNELVRRAAEQQGRPPSNLANHLLRNALKAPDRQL